MLSAGRGEAGRHTVQVSGPPPAPRRRPGPRRLCGHAGRPARFGSGHSRTDGFQARHQGGTLPPATRDEVAGRATALRRHDAGAPKGALEHDQNHSWCLPLVVAQPPRWAGLAGPRTLSGDGRKRFYTAQNRTFAEHRCADTHQTRPASPGRIDRLPFGVGQPRPKATISTIYTHLAGARGGRRRPGIVRSSDSCTSDMSPASTTIPMVRVCNAMRAFDRKLHVPSEVRHRRPRRPSACALFQLAVRRGGC